MDLVCDEILTDAEAGSLSSVDVPRLCMYKDSTHHRHWRVAAASTAVSDEDSEVEESSDDKVDRQAVLPARLVRPRSTESIQSTRRLCVLPTFYRCRWNDAGPAARSV